MIRLALSLVVLATVTGLRAETDRLAAGVVVVANASDADSLRIARHYMEQRGIPAANLIALDLPREETIPWGEFVAGVWQPLREALVRKKWIDAIGMSLSDEYGRRKYAVAGHRIAYLVLCRGVPLRIADEPTLAGNNPPYTNNANFRTNRAAVDSELSLLAASAHNINAFAPNPLYRKEQPGFPETSQVIKVSRLDGPSAEDVIGLIDRTLTAEKQGLIGRAYVDIGGPHSEGDRWLETVSGQLQQMGFDTTVDRRRESFGVGDRFDAPALYFGWYEFEINGPFTAPGFEFPPGAIAFHINSFSAETLRSATSRWAGPLVARGVTATFGNVYEPYLQLTHRPDMVLHMLARGGNLGDATYYALPALSWQCVVIGDPLYRPFAVPLDEQLRKRRELPARHSPYPVLSKINLLKAAKQEGEALRLAREEFRKQPSVPLALALAELLEKTGDKTGAVGTLGILRQIEPRRTEDWGMWHQAALTLEKLGSPGGAVDIYRQLLKIGPLPKELRISWLREGARVASLAKDFDQETAWNRNLAEMLPPSKKVDGTSDSPR